MTVSYNREKTDEPITNEEMFKSRCKPDGRGHTVGDGKHCYAYLMAHVRTAPANLNNAKQTKPIPNIPNPNAEQVFTCQMGNTCQMGKRRPG